MAKNRTFTELSNDVVINGNYHVRYVMENDSPRFVLTDIMDSLGYANPSSSTNTYCRRFGLGKVVGADNKLRTYASKEEAEKIFAHLYLITTEFRDFWKNEVIPVTDQKYSALRDAVSEEKEKNRRLNEVYETLVKENEELEVSISILKKQREQISAILGFGA